MAMSQSLDISLTPNSIFRYSDGNGPHNFYFKGVSSNKIYRKFIAGSYPQHQRAEEHLHDLEHDGMMCFDH